MSPSLLSPTGSSFLAANPCPPPPTSRGPWLRSTCPLIGAISGSSSSDLFIPPSSSSSNRSSPSTATFPTYDDLDLDWSRLPSHLFFTQSRRCSTRGGKQAGRRGGSSNGRRASSAAERPMDPFLTRRTTRQWRLG